MQPNDVNDEVNRDNQVNGNQNMTEQKRKNKKSYLPLAFALILCAGLYLGSRLNVPFAGEKSIFTFSTYLRIWESNQGLHPFYIQ